MEIYLKGEKIILQGSYYKFKLKQNTGLGTFNEFKKNIENLYYDENSKIKYPFLDLKSEEYGFSLKKPVLLKSKNIESFLNNIEIQSPVGKLKFCLLGGMNAGTLGRYKLYGFEIIEDISSVDIKYKTLVIRIFRDNEISEDDYELKRIPSYLKYAKQFCSTYYQEKFIQNVERMNEYNRYKFLQENIKNSNTFTKLQEFLYKSINNSFDESNNSDDYFGDIAIIADEPFIFDLLKYFYDKKMIAKKLYKELVCLENKYFDLLDKCYGYKLCRTSKF